MSIHQYEASFRVSGERLDIQALTALTRMQPDNTHMKGDRKSDRLVWSDSLWEISSRLPLTSDLGSHLKELISRIEPVISEIRRSVNSDSKIFFWCAHYTDAHDGFCGGPTLDARLLSKIGELGIALSLQTYAGTNMGKT